MRAYLVSRTFLMLWFLFVSQRVFAQDVLVDANPFAKYFGVWGLKDGKFMITEDNRVVNTLIFQNHITECHQVNTQMTALCTITADGLAGHVLWSYDKTAARMHHLSHFGPVGKGVNAIGLGEIDKDGNIHSKVTFEDLPKGFFRSYEYIWLSENSYEMNAKEFDAQGLETGRGYAATYIRQ